MIEKIRKMSKKKLEQVYNNWITKKRINKQRYYKNLSQKYPISWDSWN